ncbi:MAG: DUF72 domain-containing protein [Calditrichaeota bacterium]|nr:MAG: DUF72 domain-containing protein [Calditrichota bacterium]MBL1207908.1 DUF72 domain-containing protein [Calditrichota bacterium]NOG47743.1 DUF72 domain-containing protein [Calditrichota bacterium]
MNLLCGTSGFSYKEWKGSFYPQKHPDKEMLSYYASQLTAVEINNTFYRMPKENVLQAWAEKVPDTFKFSIKASRKITHFKRLKECEDECGYLFKMVRTLEKKLGCILFQLPPNLKIDIERLEKFLKIIPDDIKAAFEFRHPSWLIDDIYQMLNSKNCSLVITETDEAPKAKFTETADWTYLRLRRTQYSKEELSERMEKIKKSNWEDVLVFFKHEDEGTGPRLAKQFMELS